MSAEPVLFERDGAIARLVLSRPDQGNAIDLDMARTLFEAAVRCDTDGSIRCVVLTGAGRLFCAGGDVGVMAKAGDDAPAVVGELASTLHMAVARLARMRKPLLVLVNGPAAGAGLSLAIAGDVVIAGESAHFTAAYGAIGLSPDGGMSWLLPRLVGLRKAQDIILSNRRIKSDEAERIGLVTRTVADDALAAEGEAAAGTLAASATAALGAARALLTEAYTSGLETQMEREVRAISHAAGSAECKEGLAALFAKRKPDFEGAGS
ncbi:MAG: enoyl-CoA hydratase/isomerase family protein [Novosphingobium sp.]